jgi:hypothetical protein
LQSLSGMTLKPSSLGLLTVTAETNVEPV